MACNKVRKFHRRFANEKFDLENTNKDCNLEINKNKLARN
jgi:hypothetical protein